MPLVTAMPKGQGNGQVITEFVDSVGTTSTTYTYPTTQEYLAIKNTGVQPLKVTVGAISQTIQSGKRWETTSSFSSFDIASTSGVQSFEATTDENGSAFTSPEGQYFGTKNDIENLSVKFERPRRSLEDIFQNAMGLFFNGQKSLDVENPARTYTLQFSKSTATNLLVLPIYSGLATSAGSDNDTFKADKAYVAEVFQVYDLTADPTRTTNILSSFRRSGREITLTAASDNTVRLFEVVCIGVPYQGLMPQLASLVPGNTAFEIVYDPGKILCAADGYANSGAVIASPLVGRLPLDYASDADASFSGSVTVATGGTAARWAWLDWVTTLNYAYPHGQILYFSGTVGSLRGLKLASSTLNLDANPLSAAANPFLSTYFALAKVVRIKDDVNHDNVFQNGELVLLVVSTVNTTTKPTIFAGTAASNSADVFRLPGRPILDGEVFIV